jgi:hypothetical protein
MAFAGTRRPLPEWLAAIVPALALCALTVAVLAIRRPDQFTHPYIFIEDGQIMQAYAQQGVSAVFGLIHGFPNLISRVITVTSFKLSALHAPAIGVALTTAFTCFVVLCIYFAPTHLRARFVCAAIPLLIPAGPETFAVPLMSFWWAGLLLFLALLWCEGHQGWRIVFILLGGLSSAVVIPLSGLFALRALLERRASEWIAAGAALACALLSAVAGILYAVTAPPEPPRADWILLGIGKFVGWFTSSGFLSDQATGVFLAWGVGTLIVLAALTWASRARLDRYVLLLVAALMLVSLATVLRAPLEGMHPYYAGPRYFFYQFIMIGWLLAWIAAESQGALRVAAAGVLAFAIVQGFGERAFRWRHEHWDWKAHMLACAGSGEYDVPIHYMGGKANPYSGDLTWHVRLTGAECRGLIANSLFGKV